MRIMTPITSPTTPVQDCPLWKVGLFILVVMGVALGTLVTALGDVRW